MSVIVEALEKENLDIMRQLFDYKVDDLNLARWADVAATSREFSHIHRTSKLPA